MKKCIISLNLLYYITFFHRFNGAESQTASLSTGQSTSGTAAVDSASTNPPVTDTVTPVTLDINISKDTDQIDYKKDGEFRTYTPKDNHVFKKVVKKNADIWSAKPNDKAIKAVLMGSKKEPKHLALLLQSGEYVLLHKSGKNKPWNDITNAKYDVTKLKFLGEGDSEISKSDYDVDLHDLSYTFLFKSGVTCRKVLFGDDDVWKHTDDPNYSDIKSLQLDLPTNKFLVKNQSDQSKELTKAKVSVYVNATQSEGTDQSRSRSSGGTPKGEGTDQSRSSGGTPNSGSGEGTDQSQSRSSGGTEERIQLYSGSSDYEKLLDQNLQGMTW
ncbi:SfiI-subtelomeric fragment related protein family member, putative [Theileria annulata]|uniref:SfiI-subtelomeric related protein family member, putative n=1 Tax=Theileria annulata TaxID=5874 RepID=Q4UAS7_THEAN|nr:SfiI-subtelomeric fragment related protein family member, putative [Theileria annulata]CAI76074.1 SfiI-subtelomeric fragment related protein family member, putative [Theileria annulata]